MISHCFSNHVESNGTHGTAIVKLLTSLICASTIPSTPPSSLLPFVRNEMVKLFVAQKMLNTLSYSTLLPDAAWRNLGLLLLVIMNMYS